MASVEDRWYREVKHPDGTVEKVQTDRHGTGLRWLARWRDPDGKPRKQSFSKQALAKAHAAAQESDRARGQYIDGTDRTTVSQACRAWLERRPVRDTTRARWASLIREHVDGTPLGSRRLTTVKPSDVGAWVTGRSAVLAPATVRKAVQMLRSVFADAVLDRVVAANPVVRVSLPSVTRERVVPLSVAQVRQLADAVPGRYRAMVLAQAGLGLRVGELLGLRVADVDFLRRTVRVEHQSHTSHRGLVPPKTGSSRRTVPLPGFVAEVLAAHLAAHPAGPDVECGCPADVKCSRSVSPLIFRTATGGAIDQEQHRRVFASAVKRVNKAIREANEKLPKDAAKDAELPADTTSHDLRHHYASVLLAAGESVVAVAERLGHDGAGLVLNTYGHLLPDSDDRTRKAIDSAYNVAAAEALSCAPSVPPRSAATS